MGRKWIAGPESTFEGEPDARFIDNERDSSKPVGKLAENEAFLRMRSLFLRRKGVRNLQRNRSMYRALSSVG